MPQICYSGREVVAKPAGNLLHTKSFLNKIHSRGIVIKHLTSRVWYIQSDYVIIPTSPKRFLRGGGFPLCPAHR